VATDKIEPILNFIPNADSSRFIAPKHFKPSWAARQNSFGWIGVGLYFDGRAIIGYNDQHIFLGQSPPT